MADEYFVDTQSKSKSYNKAGVNATKRNQVLKDHNQDKDEMTFVSNTNEEFRDK